MIEPTLPFGTREVVEKASDAAFGKALVTNVLRGHLVEAMIALALEPEWTWCGADFASWDFERSDGVRLEVKQSSRRQSWATMATTKIAPRFDVTARTGRYEGNTFIPEPGRAAHLYIFAYHDCNDETADHRDPAQWEFFVMSANMLPNVAHLGLGSIRRMTPSVSIAGLATKVQEVAAPHLPSFAP